MVTLVTNIPCCMHKCWDIMHQKMTTVNIWQSVWQQSQICLSLPSTSILKLRNKYQLASANSFVTFVVVDDENKFEVYFDNVHIRNKRAQCKQTNDLPYTSIMWLICILIDCILPAVVIPGSVMPRYVSRV